MGVRIVITSLYPSSRPKATLAGDSGQRILFGVVMSLEIDAFRESYSHSAIAWMVVG